VDVIQTTCDADMSGSNCYTVTDLEVTVEKLQDLSTN
jgi:hypothetical protein